MGSSRLNSLATAPSSEPMIEVEHLTYRYPKQTVPALNHLSLKVKSGIIFGVLGPNGGGKSTTFKMLSTLLSPQEGSIKIAGVDVKKSPEQVRARLGVVFQSPALDKKLTAQENLLHHGHLYGMRGKRLQEKTDLLLKQMGLWEKREEKTERLSGGQKRRLEIAKSLIHDPKILILDEPTTGLDPLARKEVWSHLKFLRDQEGLTILVTTHLLDEANDCDEIALIDQGQLVCEGKPLELRATLGKDLVTIRTENPKQLADEIESKLQEKTRCIGNDVRVHPAEVKGFLQFLFSDGLQAFESFSVGKPTLEDLFIEKTGRQYEREATIPPKGGRK